MNRYPFAPLAAAMQLTEAHACRVLNLSGSTAVEYRRDGVSRRVADRLAVAAGLHPYEVWPEMVDDDIADVRAVEVERETAEQERQRAAWRRRWERMTREQRAARASQARRYRAEVRAAVLRRRVRVCAANDCTETFVAERGDRRYCSARCRQRVKMRAYRSRLQGRQLLQAADPTLTGRPGCHAPAPASEATRRSVDAQWMDSLEGAA